MSEGERDAAKLDMQETVNELTCKRNIEMEGREKERQLYAQIDERLTYGARFCTGIHTIEFHVFAPLEALPRVVRPMPFPLGGSLLLAVGTVHCVQTLKVLLALRMLP
jgi:hypothetical protein